MVKYFCDRCGKEIKTELKIIPKDVARGSKGNSILVVFNNGILCEECAKKFEQVKDQLEHEEDIFDMTDEEIELLHYTFKVGDEIITKDGRVGTIIDICTCDSCKKRGFYEPTIEFEDGDKDYIMISEKNSGFKSYYKIGDHVFGNLDEAFVQKEMMAHFTQMAKLQKQCETIQKLKNAYLN